MQVNFGKVFRKIVGSLISPPVTPPSSFKFLPTLFLYKKKFCKNNEAKVSEKIRANQEHFKVGKFRRSHRMCSLRKGILRNCAKFTGNSQPQGCNFTKIETLAQLLFCEFYEISKNTFFTEHLWVTAFRSSNTKNLKNDDLYFF